MSSDVSQMSFSEKYPGVSLTNVTASMGSGTRDASTNLDSNQSCDILNLSQLQTSLTTINRDVNSSLSSYLSLESQAVATSEAAPISIKLSSKLWDSKIKTLLQDLDINVMSPTSGDMVSASAPVKLSHDSIKEARCTTDSQVSLNITTTIKEKHSAGDLSGSFTNSNDGMLTFGSNIGKEAEYVAELMDDSQLPVSDMSSSSLVDMRNTDLLGK